MKQSRRHLGFALQGSAGSLSRSSYINWWLFCWLSMEFKDLKEMNIGEHHSPSEEIIGQNATASLSQPVPAECLVSQKFPPPRFA